jgi:hypothetical protein
MNFPDTYTLLQSTVATVRVSPPDLVSLEGPSVGPLHFRRSLLRECKEMTVSYYRDKHDASFAAGCDGDFVIRFRVEGMPRELLGPFDHTAGAALAYAIKLARRDVLFAIPSFSVSVSDDTAKLCIRARGRHAVSPGSRHQGSSSSDLPSIPRSPRATWSRPDCPRLARRGG